MGKVPSQEGINVVFSDDKTNRQYSCAHWMGILPTDPNIGSADWLHDIYLANSEADLRALIAEFPAEGTRVPLTSGSSPHARVFTADTVDGRTTVGQYMDQYVVATNVNTELSAEDSKTIVDELLISSTFPQDGYFTDQWQKELGNRPVD